MKHCSTSRAACIRYRTLLSIPVILALGGSRLSAQALPEQNATAPQAEQAGGVSTNATGTGTKNKLALWTDSTTLGSSIITQLNLKIGIGDPNPTSKLTVNAGDRVFATIRGTNTAAGAGVTGNSATGNGVLGISAAVNPQQAAGVFGKATEAGGTGVFGEGINGASNGVWGRTSSGYGVRGEHSSGTTGAAVYGTSTATDGNGVLGEANTGAEAFAIWGKSTNGEAGHFTGKVVVNGDLEVLGNIKKDTGTFRIDHPQDPANKYLLHSFVESPDMMNVYNGNVVLNRNGGAVVQLPAYFQALNTEFRYQLTAIGAPGPNLFIAQEIYDNHFTIAGGTPGMKVSWQVTGIRQDPYANAHRVPVEAMKPAKEIGSFLHPESYGQPKERGVEYVRYPKVMARENATAELATERPEPDRQ